MTPSANFPASVSPSATPCCSSPTRLRRARRQRRHCRVLTAGTAWAAPSPPVPDLACPQCPWPCGRASYLRCGGCPSHMSGVNTVTIRSARRCLSGDVVSGRSKEVNRMMTSATCFVSSPRRPAARGRARTDAVPGRPPSSPRFDSPATQRTPVSHGGRLCHFADLTESSGRAAPEPFRPVSWATALTTWLPPFCAESVNTGGYC